MNVKPVRKENFHEVVEMLQSISEFYPKKDDIEVIWNAFAKQKNHFAYCFYHDKNLIGYGSYLIEIKIRGGRMSHIEDVVVAEKHRSKGYGKLIINNLVEDSILKGCYKISLSCKNHNIKFYENCGFKLEGNTLSKLI